MVSVAAGEGKQYPQARLWERLTEVRHQQFVGRTPERTLFETALSAADLPFFVLYIFGPGGVGKTTLLHELAYICSQRGTQAVYLDGRDLQPSPEGFLEALRLALQAPAEQSPWEALLAQPERRVILIDTYETLASLDNWLVKAFLPELPENILLVLAGRQGPSSAWQADPGLRALTRVVPLRNFSSEESELFLARRELPSEQYQTILNFTHGHPLALSLVADKFAQNGDVFVVRATAGASASQSESEADPDLIKTLLQRLIQEAPTAAHRAALEVCSLVRVTSEPLLAELLGISDAYELFEWLRNLSFIQFGPRGLFPHDLTQNVLDADLRWRNPDRYVELVERARNYYIGRLPQVSSQEQQALVIDYIFLYRHSPVIQPFVKISPSVSELPDLARSADWPLLVQMVARHEGEEAARLAEFWFSRQPQGVVVWRRADGGGGSQPLGFMLTLALNAASPEELAQDPAAAAAWAYLQRHAPLRPGDKATIFRFWMGEEGYQTITPVQGLIGVAMVWHYLTAPGLAFTFFPCADPDFWAPLCAHARLDRLYEADYEVGGRRYGVYGHDWRAMPPLAWLTLMAGQEFGLTAVVRATTGASAPAPPTQAQVEPLAVLSYSDFAEATREALRNLTIPQHLQDNPLLRSRLVVEANKAGSPAEVLRALLVQAIEALQVAPRQTKLYRALYHTYLHPAPSQEQAAELLDLPYSTFRRHLKAGVEEVTRLLWEREIG